jgi:hypothetical protein
MAAEQTYTVHRKIGRPGGYKVRALVAGVFFAVGSAIDNFIMHQVLVDPTDKLVGPLTYLVFGYWAAIATNIVWNSIVGTRFEANYIGIECPSRQALMWTAVAGLLSSVGTLFYLLGHSLVDVSIVLPLSSTAVLYLVVYDGMRNRINLRDVLFPTMLVFLGSAMITVQRLDVVSVSITALLLVLVIDQGMTALGEITSQRGLLTSGSVSFHFWRCLWGAMFTTVGVGIVVVLTGRFSAIIVTAWSGFLNTLILITVRMSILWISQVLCNQAKQKAPVSEVNILTTVKVLLGIPIALLGSFMAVGAFGSVTPDPRVWILRAAGTLMMMWGLGGLYRKR